MSHLSISDFASHLLYSENLSDKLIERGCLNLEKKSSPPKYTTEIPGRCERLKFSNKQIKFPKKGLFYKDEAKGKAFHFFANHELLAIEMFAWALLEFEWSDHSQRVLLETIFDEQKHLKLYIERMKGFGLEFGDLPLNDFFWRYIKTLKTKEEFYALMALTFEQANLDFAIYYRDLFREVEDEQSSTLMQIVYQDEISHVARGVQYLKKQIKDKDLWSYYNSLLPENITAVRAKGISFDAEGRARVGLDEMYINELKEFKGNFKVLQRKEWKK